MAQSGIVWRRSPAELAAAVGEYGNKVLAAVHALARMFEPMLESYAKQHAPWTDRTGNARQSLFSASELAETVVMLYLSHGVEYGVYLELNYGGRYAIILPTLQAHYPQISAALKGLLK